MNPPNDLPLPPVQWGPMAFLSAKEVPNRYHGLDRVTPCTDEQFATCPHELNLDTGNCPACGREPPKPKRALSKAEQSLVAAQVANALSAPERLPAKDMVNLPHHYARFKIEPIRYCVENGLNFMQSNIVKYSARYDAKNGLEDLAKTVRNSIMLMRFAGGDPDWWKPDPYTPQIIKAYGKPHAP